MSVSWPENPLNAPLPSFGIMPLGKRLAKWTTKPISPKKEEVEVMIEESAQEKQKQEIREQINALQALADQLPESKDEAIAQLDALEKKIRVMQEERNRSETEDDTYIGS